MGLFAQVHIYLMTGTSFSLKQSLSHQGAVTDVAYSPDGNYLVASDGHRKVVLYSLPDYQVKYSFNYQLHTIIKYTNK